MADVDTEGGSFRMGQIGSDPGNGWTQGPNNPATQMTKSLSISPVAGPDQGEAPETHAAAMSNFEGMMESQVHINDEMVMEAHLLAFKMVGKVFYDKMMERTGFPILPQLLSSLRPTLQKLQTDNVQVTMETFKKEASKWVYGYMRGQNRRVAVHPQHIRDIPKNWRLQNPDRFYPSDEEFQDMALDTGLEKRQVSSLFENERKRNLQKDVSDLEGKLKSHFPAHITQTLRAWQAQNQPRRQPNQDETKDLMEETGLNKKQIVDWFNNHRVGRNRSKRRTSI